MANKDAYLKSDESIGQMFGRLGGQATFKKIGKEGMKELSNKALQARLEKGQIKNIRG